MATKIKLVRRVYNGPNDTTKLVYKNAPIGFSWTTFFFGALPSLCRGDWLNALIIFIAFLTSNITSTLFVLVTNEPNIAVIVSSVLNLTLAIIFGCVVNKTYNQKLANKWYVDWEKTKKMYPKAYHHKLMNKLLKYGYLFK